MAVEKIKTALIQFNAGMNKEQNIKRVRELVLQAAAQGARLILLPESFWFRSENVSPGSMRKAAERVNGPTVREFQLLAKQKQVFVLLGSIYERRLKEKQPYNTALLIAPDGKIAFRYRKIHLFKATVQGRSVRESTVFSPGRTRASASVDGFFTGCAICYDLRFPEMFRTRKKNSYDMVFVPSNFTYETGRAHWESLLRARAIENRCYVLAPNQCGKTLSGILSFGNSMVVDPWGRVIARLPAQKEGILFAVIDKKEIILARQKTG